MVTKIMKLKYTLYWFIVLWIIIGIVWLSGSFIILQKWVWDGIVFRILLVFTIVITAIIWYNS